MSNDNNVESLDDFVKKVSDYRFKNPGKDLFYRGENSKYPSRLPSIYRVKENKIAIESGNYYKRLAVNSDNAQFVNGSLFDRLTDLQHFGGLTRLLDITTNALVALFFATEAHNNDDGYVYVYADDRFNLKTREGHTAFLKTVVNYIDFDCVQNFIKNKKDEDDRRFINELKKLDKDNIFLSEPNDELKEKMRFDLQHAQIIQVPKLNARIAHQQGAFIFPAFENELTIDNVAKSIDDLSLTVDAEPVILKIPKQFKHIIQKELVGTGINAGTVYPDFKHQSDFIVQETVGFNADEFDLENEIADVIEEKGFLFKGNPYDPYDKQLIAFINQSQVENPKLIKLRDIKSGTETSSFYMFEEVLSTNPYPYNGQRTPWKETYHYGLLTPRLQNGSEYQLIDLGYGLGNQRVENLIGQFERSRQYAMTHSLITDLNDPTITALVKNNDRYLRRVLEAAFNNSQISAILSDGDVIDYYKKIINDLPQRLSSGTDQLVKKMSEYINGLSV